MLCSILIFGLYGCGTKGDGAATVSQVVEDEKATAQEGEFEVSINVEQKGENLDVYATITYLGDQDQKTIYHGGSIFFFNVYQVGGDFEHIGGMEQPLLSTDLKKGEAHKVEFNHPGLTELKPGTYEFEAIADISIDDEKMVDTKLEVPVTTVVEID
ncbi:hypothetical protein E3U55_06375 [Filobacillus milosensis]|uniref:Intracellular proteinase inhibitor BsuPI domain-containing protein n=1 Tax=Filobacillus milosensis TaxID=94137 RepID=A0A4Y8IQP5_9BACI|nr:hypothetical protein E3U55_06375 [Filobacillus milosensis]